MNPTRERWERNRLSQGLRSLWSAVASGCSLHGSAIPTGLRHSTQRCPDEGVATLGGKIIGATNPEGGMAQHHQHSKLARQDLLAISRGQWRRLGKRWP